MRSTLLFIVCSLLTLGVYAQKNVAFEKENFESKKQFKEAINYLVKGDNYFEEGLEWYNLALDEYEKAQKLNPNNAELNYKIGVCKYVTNNPFKAFEHFEKAYELDPEVSPFIDYRLGQGHQFRKEFDLAIERYQKSIQTIQGTELEDKEDWISKVEKRKEECVNSKDFIENKTDALVYNVRGINTAYMEHSPIISIDEETIYFTSRKPVSDEKKDGVNRAYENVYTAKKNDEGVFVNPKSLSEEINNDSHMATVILSHDEKTLYLYAGNVNKGDLFYSEYKDGKWQKPLAMPKPINSKSQEVAISYSPDNKTVYFVSDRDGGYGGLDIWTAQVKDDGSYSEPEPVNETINTRYNERSVFITKDGQTMFFSSEGHKNMGGYDIFRSDMNANGNWSAPVNMGYPINTPGDDVTFVVTDDGKRGYYASLKLDCKGEYDIYTYVFPEEVKMIVMSGRILDELTKEPLMGKIIFKDNETGEEIEYTSDKEGNYSVELPKNKTYSIQVTSEGYPEHNETFTTGSEDTEKDFYLVPPKEVLALKDPISLYFDNDKPNRRSTLPTTNLSYEETYKNYIALIEEYKMKFSEGLSANEKGRAINTIRNFFANTVEYQYNEYIQFNSAVLMSLKAGKKIKLTIKGHASPLTSASYNVNLSKRRIKSIINDYQHLNNGVFRSYIENGQLSFVEEAYGETTASKDISDSRKDTRNSIYNPRAAKERYVQIIAAEVTDK